MEAVTVTIELPDDAHARLQAEASRRGITFEQLIAEIADTLPAEPVKAPVRGLAFIGAGASRVGITHRIDELLADGFGQS